MDRTWNMKLLRWKTCWVWKISFVGIRWCGSVRNIIIINCRCTRIECREMSPAMKRLEWWATTTLGQIANDKTKTIIIICDFIQSTLDTTYINEFPTNRVVRRYLWKRADSVSDSIQARLCRWSVHSIDLVNRWNAQNGRRVYSVLHQPLSSL